jgi:hypothetical protein
LRRRGEVFLAILLAAAGCRREPPAEVVEASGVTPCDGYLCVVDDSVQGAYFRLSRPPEAPGKLIALNDLHPVKVMLPNVGLLVDLEGIDRLADGRIVVLSERLHSLVGEAGLVAEYDYPLSEIGRRGLEGVAVRALEDGSSRIAVLWEGGYPDVGSLQRQVESRVGPGPFRPFIFVHDLKPGAVAGRVRMEDGVAGFELEMPLPEGVEPDAQRFRAPDLVWHRVGGDWGFIVLISSQNAATRPRFLYHWLQRYDGTGRRVGEAIDLAKLLPPEAAHANWEGLCWYEPGRSLLLVHEAGRDLPAQALILELPADWRAD